MGKKPLSGKSSSGKGTAGNRATGKASASQSASPARGARLLVQCEACLRQYDASGQAPESRFHCHCGEMVTVKAPRGHDASVVRCSNCGAPRESQSLSCGFCRGDFTLHERDLETVCPACQARVSNRAKFCHHCGTALTAELVAGTASLHQCPVCPPRPSLVSRALPLERVAVLECPRCVGLWIGLETLHQILEAEPRRDAKSSGNHVPAPPGTSKGYRPCVVCGELMARRNFGFASSGVIVDICGRHGIWFDADEFMQLLAWVRAGGLESARDDLARLSGSPDKVRQRAVRRRIPTQPTPLARDPSSAQLAEDETPFGRTLTALTHLVTAGDVLGSIVASWLSK